MEPLQRRKVSLRSAGRDDGKVVNGNGNKRKAYTRTTFYEHTKDEIDSFSAIQPDIATGPMLSHLDPAKRLFLQLGGSISRGFGGILFHLKDNYKWKPGAHIPANAVLPIAFISKTLRDAETRYGPTELEMAALVWAVKRQKPQIGSMEGKLVVLTGHSAAKPIVEKTSSVESTSPVRTNRRLVKAPIYLSENSTSRCIIYRKEELHP